MESEDDRRSSWMRKIGFGSSAQLSYHESTYFMYVESQILTYLSYGARWFSTIIMANRKLATAYLALHALFAVRTACFDVDFQYTCGPLPWRAVSRPNWAWCFRPQRTKAYFSSAFIRVYFRNEHNAAASLAPTEIRPCPLPALVVVWTRPH